METTEIIDVISRGKDRRQQFKADMTNADAFSAEIVAFSNTACGSILIGVNDDGSVRGLSGADLARLNQLVSNAASQNVRPAVNKHWPCRAGEPAEFGKNRTVSTADRRQALVQPGLCPIEVHLNPSSDRSWAPSQTRAVFCIS